MAQPKDGNSAMNSSSRRITAPQPASNAFPQADSLPRMLDVLALAGRNPKLDENSLAEIFGITPRQGSYYYAAAAYVGLTYKRGGWIKPTQAGEGVNRIQDEEARRSAVFEMVMELPVFREAAIHAAEYGCLPPVEELTAWVMAEDSKVNATTAARRAETVDSWIRLVMREAPDVIAELPVGPAMAPG